WRQVSDLVAGGVPVAEALRVTARATPAGLSREIDEVRRRVENGSPVWHAVAGGAPSVPAFCAGLLRAGESAGALEAALAAVADHLEREVESRRRLRQALAYPALVMVLAAAVCVFLVLVVVPRFQTLFDEMGQHLPLPTRVLMGAAGVMNTAGPAGIVAGGVFLTAGRPALARLLRRARRAAETLPFLRRIAATLAAARWSSIMATLVRSGVNVPEALALSREALGSHPAANGLLSLERDVAGGAGLGASIRAAEIFPPIVGDVIEAGERSGRLEESLARLAESLERSSGAALALAAAMIEPALVIATAAVVGFVALAMLLPIFDLSAGLK
ncbi:MAG: type II secretion system F family protein, partial [Elusimicrobia bacterium]|nr:type II secretion system F family protein [Elusimicrobiota bacterium]